MTLGEEKKHVTREVENCLPSTCCFGIELNWDRRYLACVLISIEIIWNFFTFCSILLAFALLCCIGIEMFDNLGADFYRILGCTCSRSNRLLSFHRIFLSFVWRKEKNIEWILNEHFFVVSSLRNSKWVYKSLVKFNEFNRIDSKTAQFIQFSCNLNFIHSLATTMNFKAILAVFLVVSLQQVNLIHSDTLFHTNRSSRRYISFPPEANLHIEIGLSEVSRKNNVKMSIKFRS